MKRVDPTGIAGGLAVAAVLLGGAAAGHAQALPEDDRVRLAEAFAVAEAVQECVWPGWSSAPFSVLLVSDEHEFLVRHPAPSVDFAPIGYDSLLEATVYVRERVYSPELLATFPAVGGVPTVVIGPPERTGKSSTLWVLTVLHEHFHQLQYSQPGYYDAAAALDLSGGDESGMWMLNYPFPYRDAEVQAGLREYAEALQGALAAAYSPGADSAYQHLGEVRGRLREIVDDADDRYLSFQLWQEGVARYIEHRIARAAAGRHTPLPAFERLEDFVPYSEAAERLRRTLVRELAELDIGAAQREWFYPLGAVQALVLDLMQPEWQSRYLREKFHLDPR